MLFRIQRVSLFVSGVLHPRPNRLCPPRVISGTFVGRIGDTSDVELSNLTRTNTLAILAPRIERSGQPRTKFPILPNSFGVLLVNHYYSVKVKGRD